MQNNKFTKLSNSVIIIINY